MCRGEGVKKKCLCVFFNKTQQNYSSWYNIYIDVVGIKMNECVESIDTNNVYLNDINCKI